MHNKHSESGEKNNIAPCKYMRIVSLSPSITETLFALGLGDKVVGVTRFCKYPPEALKIQKVGGYLDLNYEAVVNLKPDVVFILPEQQNAGKYFKELGIDSVELHNRLTADIMETVLKIGHVCGKQKEAEKLHSELTTQMENIKEKIKSKNRPRVLVCVDRVLSFGSIKEMYIAGKKTSYDELINIAGGINAYSGNDISYPTIYREGLLELNPEIIIDIIPELKEKGLTKEQVIGYWKKIPGVDAIKNNRIYIIDQDYAVIPGPRFILFLKELVTIIHPEIKTD